MSLVSAILAEGAPALARLLAEGASVHLAAVGADGRVALANQALTRLVGRQLVGVPMAALLAESSHRTLSEACASGYPDGFTLLSVLDANGDPVSLRCLFAPFRDGYLVIGEPVFDHYLDYAAQLQSVNAELAVLLRENARQARAIAAAHQELREAHWHIKKIAKVLPMCMACSKVRTGPETWEDLASYLLRSTDFLSHGYCAGCAERLIADLDKEPGP
jgi:hypothetical protein